jgi:uncharacterized OsmC-like protein
MEQTLKVSVGNLKGKMQLTGIGHANKTVAIDYPAPLGEDNGFTSLELLMVSLASCSSHSIQYVLGTMGLKLEDLKAEAVGQRRIDQHKSHSNGRRQVLSCLGDVEEGSRDHLEVCPQVS